ncbi:MAG: hypothetical protein Q9M45_08795 [Robiginitomaculum sp.]|nr:hypothetical protein [Robiginitomaculum sp.]
MTAPIAALAPSLSSALKRAAGRAGVSFDFMVRTAARESGLDSSAKAKTSSAAGLFQFVEQTWLNMVSRHGASHGLAKEAKAVVADPNGRLVVKDQAEYQRILDLRFDPKVSAQMAGELTRENAQVLSRHLGRKPQEAELYIAHFMGAGQAAALINAADITPGARAATLFPKEAKANQPIFFEKRWHSPHRKRGAQHLKIRPCSPGNGYCKPGRYGQGRRPGRWPSHPALYAPQHVSKRLWRPGSAPHPRDPANPL